MSGRMLWVDDCKPAPHGCDVARDFGTAWQMLMEGEMYDVLYLDHDLGDRFDRTGYDLLCDLFEADRVPLRVECISMNPVGRDRILAALASHRERVTAKEITAPSPPDALSLNPSEGQPNE